MFQGSIALSNGFVNGVKFDLLFNFSLYLS